MAEKDVQKVAGTVKNSADYQNPVKPRKPNPVFCVFPRKIKYGKNQDIYKNKKYTVADRNKGIVIAVNDNNMTQTRNKRADNRHF